MSSSRKLNTFINHGVASCSTAGTACRNHAHYRTSQSSISDTAQARSKLVSLELACETCHVADVATLQTCNPCVTTLDRLPFSFSAVLEGIQTTCAVCTADLSLHSLDGILRKHQCNL